MRSLKMLGLCTAILSASSIAFASAIITPSRGPTGSPPYTSSMTIGVVDGGVSSCNGSESPSDTACDFTVGLNDTVTGISITLPDATGNVLCGISNAFIDGGSTVNVGGQNGFEPTTTGSGASETATCSYTTFTGINTNPAENQETVSRQETDCFNYNAGNGANNDSDDCGGVPYDPTGTGQGDVVFTLTGETGTFDATVSSTIVTPEPGSLALLLIGLGSVGILGYRRKQAEVA